MLVALPVKKEKLIPLFMQLPEFLKVAKKFMLLQSVRTGMLHNLSAVVFTLLSFVENTFMMELLTAEMAADYLKLAEKYK